MTSLSSDLALLSLPSAEIRAFRDGLRERFMDAGTTAEEKLLASGIRRASNVLSLVESAEAAPAERPVAVLRALLGAAFVLAETVRGMEEGAARGAADRALGHVIEAAGQVGLLEGGDFLRAVNA